MQERTLGDSYQNTIIAKIHTYCKQRKYTSWEQQEQRGTWGGISAAEK